MGLITINGNTLHPAAPAAVRRTLGAAVDDAAESNYILIQSNIPLRKAEKQRLSDLDVAIKEYVSDNTYLCRYEPTDLSSVRDLDFIDYANVYPKMFVVNPSLRTHVSGPPGHISSKLHTVDIILHKDVDLTTCKNAVCEAAHVDPDDVSGDKDKIRLTVQEQHLDAIAALDHVATIQEVTPNRLFNNVARGILNAANINVGGTTLDGSGQIIAVGDTGIDKDHPAFAGGRIDQLIPLGPRGKTNDPDGQGTHVCGSVLGSSTLSDGTPIQGSAPAAHLVMQSLLDSRGGLGGIPPSLNALFGPAYAAGARVHNNSWGSSTPGLADDRSCHEIDAFVAQHPDMLIVFAAGNDGLDRDRNGTVDLRQIGSQAAAKNCLTVGASENHRPDLTVAYGILPEGRIDSRFTAEPIFGDQYADDPDGMAAFSSRGPTRERRIKPDIVAPGTCILSARSRTVVDSKFYGISPDPDYMFESGTSMAAPLASGCAALIRQFLVANPPNNQGVAAVAPGGGAQQQQPLQPSPPAAPYSPTAALVKALLINGATPLPGQYNPTEAGLSPNPNSGWGRVSVADSAVAEGPTAGYGEHLTGLEDDETFASEIDIGEENRGKTLKVTLVWTDAPGVMLQNDLDLSVKMVVGGREEERRGNMGRGDGGWDRLNNVEQVVWEGVGEGKVEVEVRAWRVVEGRQGFAWAWRLF